MLRRRDADRAVKLGAGVAWGLAVWAALPAAAAMALRIALRRAVRLAGILAIPLLAPGCGERPPQDRLQVAVSVPPQAFLVQRVGGALVTVQTMLAPGTSEHAVELSPRQMAALSDARLYVKVGHRDMLVESRRIDPFLAAHPAILVVDMAAAALQDSASRRTVRALDAGDPHLWLSPSVMRSGARAIANGLRAVDAAHAAEYDTNLGLLLADIDVLDGDVRALLAPRAEPDAAGPPEPRATPTPPRRCFMVYHPAWGFFAREYGLRQVSIEEEGKEPGPARLQQLIAQARHAGVRTIFVQRGFSTKSAHVVAEEIGAQLVELDPMTTDWLAGMRQAARAIRDGLSADVGQDVP
jgi:zinc transport system substrate-binding protein